MITHGGVDPMSVKQKPDRFQQLWINPLIIQSDDATNRYWMPGK